MTAVQVRAEIELVLGQVEFTEVGDIGYCSAVQKALKERVAGTRVEVRFALGKLHVEVRATALEPVVVTYDLA